MQKTIVTLPEITLLGLTARTGIQFEMSPMTSKIGPCAQRYFADKIADKMIARITPGSTRCVYAEYESDHMGPYTFFIGEEVENPGDSTFVVPEGLTKLVIPAQTYAKFTTESGPMPAVVIQAWQKIWNMKPDELGGTRAFTADFQVHDERSANPMSTVLDLYVALTVL